MAAARSVPEEFAHLMEKANKKFARLRDLPPYGRAKWDVYFHKTFHVYANLWKFQQEHRAKLVENGLKRWEIGEIASRIGQLYYSYYLRTSETSFLHEAYVFYEAVGSREYFREAARSDSSLANKQLRYIARFIMVCLLLNRRDMIRRLLRLFRSCVEGYNQNFQDGDGKEWKNLLQEIAYFMKTDSICECIESLRFNILLEKNIKDFPVLKGLSLKHDNHSLKLKDAILTSFHVNEVIFTDLTLDMFRMIQSLEYEPKGMFFKSRKGISEYKNSSDSHQPIAEPKGLTSETAGSSSEADISQPDANSEPQATRMESDKSSIPSKISNVTRISKSKLLWNQFDLNNQDMIRDQSLPRNPHKTFLFHPTVTRLIFMLANAIEELPENCVLLFYISGSGCKIKPDFFSSQTKSKKSTGQKSMEDGKSSSETEVSATSKSNTNSRLEPNLDANTSESDSQIVLSSEDAIKGPVEPQNENDSEIPSSNLSGNLNDEVGIRLETLDEPIVEKASENDEKTTKADDDVHERKDKIEKMIEFDDKGIWLGLSKEAVHNTFYPQDLIPFTRKPIFLIADCDNSDAFQILSSSAISEPIVMLLSPSVQPKPKHSTSMGNKSNHKNIRSDVKSLDTSPSPDAKNQTSGSLNSNEETLNDAPNQGLSSTSTLQDSHHVENDSKDDASVDKLTNHYDKPAGDENGEDDESNKWNDVELPSVNNILPAGSAGGNLFTLFLCSPLLALCDMCEIPLSKIQLSLTEEVETLLSSIFFRWLCELYNCSSLHFAFSRLLADVFLRQYILRFIFCRACFEFHKSFRNSTTQLPKCHPELPQIVQSSSELVVSGLKEITAALGLSHHFCFDQ